MVKYALAFAAFIYAVIVIVWVNNQVQVTGCSSQAQIIFLNVGQGDSALLRSCDNSYALIDTGKDYSVITELNKYLPFGFKEFTFILITHSDADHMAALPWVLEKYSAKQIFWNKNQKQNELINTTLSKVYAQKMHPEPMYAGKDFFLGCCIKFNILWPKSDLQVRSVPDANDVSVGMKIEYGNTSLFLGGDLGTKGEDEIAVNLKQTDILKLGHHGSQTSSSKYFVSTLNPKLAVVSAGVNNSYGHPHPSVIKTLDLLGVKHISTQTEGSIPVDLNTSSYCYKLVCVNTD